MGTETGIGWTQKTWNPWHGCHKISPGCTHCYMFTEKRKYGQDPNVVVRSKTTFTAPLKWKDPSLVFTCSWSDWFVEEADPWRDEAQSIICATEHVYQILTKRIERAIVGETIQARIAESSHAWWGVSVEDRKHGLPRLEALRRLDVKQRFLSVEPILEDVGRLDLSGIGWVIVGGESGFKRRQCEIEWISNVVGQCRDQRVPVFVKQDSAFKSGQQGRIPDSLYVQEFPAAMAAMVRT